MSKEQSTPESRCVSPRELAGMAGVPPQMIYNYISADRIPAIRCSDHERWCIDREDAQAWLDKRDAKEEVKLQKIRRQLDGRST